MIDSTALGPGERDEFLGSGGVGVLSLASGEEPPYSIPVSYGYDATENDFYFRLATDPGHGKGDLDNRPASLVAYGYADDEWQSVIARGNLEKTSKKHIAAETLAGLERVHIPYVDMFGRPPRDVSFTFVRLEPEELSGRKEETSGL